MKKILLAAALAAAAYFATVPGRVPLEHQQPAGVAGASSSVGDSADALLENAFESRISNLQVSGQGTVVRVLPDDTRGSRHQRFIVRLGSGRTLLVAHNIDLAQRIDALQAGDAVAFYGEYEWNPKGGVIHWTHHDPHGRHPAGWIKRDGKMYQ